MKCNLRSLTVILCLFLLLSSATACFSPLEEPSDQTTSNLTETTTTDIVVLTPPDTIIPGDWELYKPKQTDYGNYSYRMIVDADVDSRWWGPTESHESDVMDTALYARNEYVQKFLNIEIVVENHPSSLSCDIATKDSAGDDFADVIFSTAAYAMPAMIPNGYVLDLSRVSELNLEAAYWDQRIQTEYSIDKMIFALERDFTYYDEFCTHGVFYNTELYNAYGYDTQYGSPYDMVRNGNWTMDTMLTMIKDRSDLNRGQDLTSNSQWGMLCDTAFPWIVFLGSEKKTVEIHKDGSLRLLFADDTEYKKTCDLLEDCLKKLVLNQNILFAGEDDVSNTDTDISQAETFDMFKAGKALFRAATLSDATNLNTPEDHFGILPIPKYQKAQKAYYSLCASDAHAPLMIPATAYSHLQTTATVTEVLCYNSKYLPIEQFTLLESFYENMAIINLCRSAEDYKMLELISKQKTYDLDSCLGITEITGHINSMTAKKEITDLDDTLSELKDASEHNLKKLLEDVSDNVKKKVFT